MTKRPNLYTRGNERLVVVMDDWGRAGKESCGDANRSTPTTRIGKISKQNKKEGERRKTPTPRPPFFKGPKEVSGKCWDEIGSWRIG